MSGWHPLDDFRDWKRPLKKDVLAAGSYLTGNTTNDHNQNRIEEATKAAISNSRDVESQIINRNMDQKMAGMRARDKMENDNFDPGITQYQPTAFNFNPNEDPGAKFRNDQAMKAVNWGAAAGGRLGSGGNLSQLMSRSSDLASQDYQNAFERNQQQNQQGFQAHNTFQNQKMQNMNDRFSHLNSLAGFGEAATTRMDTANTNAGADVNSALFGQANSKNASNMQAYNNTMGAINSGAKTAATVIAGLA